MPERNRAGARDVKRLQENLLSIRRLAGWTAENLGDRIGVTKQTISNLENGKTPMALTQYIAIRAVLEHEMEQHKENTVLPEAVRILLDQELDEDDYKDASGKIAAVSASAAGGTSRSSLASLFKSVIGDVITIGAAGAIDAGVTVASGVLSWLGKLSENAKSKFDNENDTYKK